MQCLSAIRCIWFSSQKDSCWQGIIVTLIHLAWQFLHIAVLRWRCQTLDHDRMLIVTSGLAKTKGVALSRLQHDSAFVFGKDASCISLAWTAMSLKITTSIVIDSQLNREPLAFQIGSSKCLKLWIFGLRNRQSHAASSPSQHLLVFAGWRQSPGFSFVRTVFG